MAKSDHSNYKTTAEGLDLIKRFEGLRLKPYLCPANVPTIGYGVIRYPNGRKVTLDDPPLTRAVAESLLRNTLKKFESAVNQAVISPIEQHQFNALVSFCYNVGITAFKNSTLLRRVNNDHCDPDIEIQFLRWVHANGKVLAGLVRRRKAEAELYFKY